MTYTSANEKAVLLNPRRYDADPRSKMIVKWNVSLIQRISDAHQPGPRVHLNDGTTTFGGIRCLCLRSDGRTLLTGGADGWIHTWEVADGKVSVKAGLRGLNATDPPLRRLIGLHI
jgi:WD40 repeat protein